MCVLHAIWCDWVVPCVVISLDCGKSGNVRPPREERVLQVQTMAASIRTAVVVVVMSQELTISSCDQSSNCLVSV